MNARKLALSVVIVAILSVLGLWGYWVYLAPQPKQVAPAAQMAEAAPELPRLVSAEGNVQPACQVSAGFPLGGRVAEIKVTKGQPVKKGEPLALLETDTLRASFKQAQSALGLAQANFQASQTQLEIARVNAHRQDAVERVQTWGEEQPSEIDLPVWYYDQVQDIASAQALVEQARGQHEKEQANLQFVLQTSGGADLLSVEKRLADAQMAFLIVEDVLERAQESPDEELEDQAQAEFDQAEKELEALQAEYERVLTEQASQDVLEARARVAIAQERYDTALDRLYALQTGEWSLQVKSAQEAVRQAEAALIQAQAAVDAAQVSLDQAVLLSPMDGVVVRIDIEAGEVATPGLPVLTIADLSAWKVETIDLAEADVARLSMGMEATITLDAFPGRVFRGVIHEISYISEDRRGDVTYTVTVDFEPVDAPVRWGMTAFVEMALP